MHSTSDLPSDKQAEIKHLAATAVADVATLPQQLVGESLEQQTASAPQRLFCEPWREKFEKWIASQRSRNPNVDDSRKSICD